MKTIKFTMLSVFLLIALLLMGEITYTRIESRHGSQLYTVYTSQLDKQSFAEAMNELPELGCGVIYEKEEIDADLRRHITVYYSGMSEERVRERLGLASLHFDSLIIGECTYELRPMSGLTASDAYSDPVLYCDGDNTAVQNMVGYLSGYDGYASVQSPTNDDRYGIVFEIAWAFIIAMTLAVTVYDIFSQYKTAAVLLVLGNRLRGLAIRNILIDTAGITASFIGVSLVLSFVTAINMNLRTIFLHWIILLILNSLCYLIFYKTDLFRALRDGEPSARLLTFNYVMKAFAALGVIAAAVYCVSTFSELGDDLAVYDEMEKLRGYSYIGIQPNMIPDIENEQGMEEFYKMKEKIYKLKSQLTDERDIIVLESQKIHPEDRENDICLAVVGSGGFDLLRLGIPDISESDRGHDLLLIPNRAAQEDIEAARSQINWLSEFEDESVKLDITERNYKSGRLFVLNSGDVEKIMSLDSPIIIYTPNDEAARELSFSSTDIIRISAEEFDAFVSENADPDISFDRLDLFGNYLHYKGSAQTFSVILILSLICAAVFELTLLVSILALEYKVNAKEICVRKILGANLIDRNKKLFGLILLTDLIGVIGAHIILSNFGMKNIVVMCVSAVILIAAELVIAFIKAVRIERVNTARILKGGAL